MYYTTLVSTDDLARHLDDPHWIVIDCRFTLTDPDSGRLVYQKSHIPGARYAHLDDDMAAPIGLSTGRHPLPDANALAQKLCNWGVGVNKQVVVYDDSFGSMAVRLWWLLRWLGHPSVALLDGGYPKWVREKRPITQDIPDRVGKGTCASLPESSFYVDTDQVKQAMESDDKLILDARPERRYSGEYEPLDPVAGHIPGAVNWNFEENLDIDGTFMPPEALRETYQALLKGRAPSDVIHMCGSGVTACHNVLAMEVAGLPGSKLYVGSWSEWITDPSRPVATGE